MIQLVLDTEEVQVLIELVDTCLADLREEIRATDSHDYKQMIKQRKEIVIKLKKALEDYKPAAWHSS